jgi:hypothetical protein
LLHLVLDSIVGDIWWLAPFVDRRYSLFTVPAVYGPSVWNQRRADQKTSTMP